MDLKPFYPHFLPYRVSRDMVEQKKRVERTLSWEVLNRGSAVEISDSHAAAVTSRPQMSRKYQSFESLKTINYIPRELEHAKHVRNRKRRLLSASPIDNSVESSNQQRAEYHSTKRNLCNERPVEQGEEEQLNVLLSKDKECSSILRTEYRNPTSELRSGNSSDASHMKGSSERMVAALKGDTVPCNSANTITPALIKRKPKATAMDKHRGRQFQQYTVLPSIGENFANTLEMMKRHEKDALQRRTQINQIQAQAKIRSIRRVKNASGSHMPTKANLKSKGLSPIIDKSSKRLRAPTAFFAVKEPLKDTRFVRLIRTLSKSFY